jgi:arginyl-tRNA synthetase
MNFKDQIAEILATLLKIPTLTGKDIVTFIKPAKKQVEADFAINCFALKKFTQRNGNQMAQSLSKQFTSSVMQSHSFLQTVSATGPFLNFTLNKAQFAKEVILDIITDVKIFATRNYKKNLTPKRIIVEFPSPNTNKPLHLGHIRNMLLGQSLSVFNKAVGNTVFQTNLLNDRGVHICKSMWAYQKYGQETTPDQEGIKSDHFVGKYYVKYNQYESNLKSQADQDPYEHLQDEIKAMLLAWEKNDPSVRALWRKMNDWAEQGYKETFHLFGIQHDKTFYESQIYNKGKDIVLQGLKDGIFEQLEDGAIVANFTKKSLPKQKVLIRRDGTSLYVTQDLYLANYKMQEFAYDQSIYVIANEQDMQLRIVFELLKKLGMTANNFHYSYGMINLTTGKMKSREGTVVDADDIVQELNDLAALEIEKRYPNLDPVEVKSRSMAVAMAALRFYILKYDYARDFLFDPGKSIAFEGETGPYVLYSYARICSIFRKALGLQISVPYDPYQNTTETGFSFQALDYPCLTDEHELRVIKLLYQFPEILEEATVKMRPHQITRFVYEISQAFTAFYHACPIVQESPSVRDARLGLCEAVRRILKYGLSLLSIDVLTEM